MNRDGWKTIRHRITAALDAGEGETGDISGIDRCVASGEINLSGVSDVLKKTGLNAAGAARLVRLWLALVENNAAATDAEVVVVATILGVHGTYPTTRLMQRPSLAMWLSKSRWRLEPMPTRAMREELDAYLDAERIDDSGLDGATVARLLREFRHRHLLRIFLREIEGASVRQTTAEVADVAEISLETALREAGRLYGEPELAKKICIMGMGKLGGRELNFSSDVDLVFVASDEAWAVDAGESVEKIARRVVELIDEVSEQGRVFRVDLRLRPEGSRGRLVPSEAGLVDYCLNWGRSWERGAWLKARAVAGDREMGERIMGRLEPFLYRRYLDFEALDELRRMKELIDAESQAADFVRNKAGDDESKVSAASHSTSPFKSRLLQKFSASSQKSAGTKKSGMKTKSEERVERNPPQGWDVKIGRGGIREIEFFVQALQLVHCGLRPELRVRTTLDALDRLLYSGLLASRSHGELADAYDLFRRLEHRVQMQADRQAHRLPLEKKAFDSLAGRMEMSPEELRETVKRSRDHVHSTFGRLFRESERAPERPTVGEEQAGILEQLIGLKADRLLDDSVIRRLREAGFSRPRQVAGQLQVLRRKEHGPFSESPSSADPQVARYLVSAVRDAPDPEGALGRLVRFATAVGDAPAMWAMLSQNPHASRLLIHLFGSSPPLGGLLADEPDVFERLIYGGSARVVRRHREIEMSLTNRLSGVGDRARRMGRIRRFHREEIIRIALHEVAGAVDVETTCRQLTDLAEVVLHALFREVVEEFARTAAGLEIDGDPVDSVGLAVVGLGKLGGREMGFGSDLDFIFVYDSGNEQGLDHETATHLAKRLVRALSMATTIGELYEVDLRLRPSGTQGTLVVSIDAWEEYYRQRAAFWERQALVRARPLTGPRSLRNRIEARRIDLAFRRPIPDGALKEMAGIRKKLQESARGESTQFDVKFDDGGLLDVEFSTQWLQLMARQESPVWQKRSTFEALRALDEAPGRRASGVELPSLLRDYTWLRRLECRLSISGVGAVVPEKGSERQALVRQMGHQGRQGNAQFEAELTNLRDRVHRALTAVFDET